MCQPFRATVLGPVDPTSEEQPMAEPTALAKVQAALRTVGSHNTSGDEWKCPIHNDREASLTVKYGTKKRDQVMLKCGAGCETKDVLAALGLTFADLRDSPTESDEYLHTVHYDYVDEDGVPLYRVKKKVYTSKKKFSQAATDGKGGWRSRSGAMTNVRRVLYRLPDVEQAIEDGKTIHLCEGEKDTDTLNDYFAAHDVPAFATCHPGGAGKWGAYPLWPYTEALAGAAHVVVWADRDAAGYACGLERLQSVLAAGLAATAVLPVPEDKGADAHDHLAAGHTPDEAVPVSADELEELASKARDQERKPRATFPAETWDDFGNAQRLVSRYADRLRWVVDNEKWAVYDQDTGLWAPRGADARAGGLARKVVERMESEEEGHYSTEAGTGSPKERSKRDDWRKWVKTNRKHAAVQAMLAQAKTKKTLHARLADFDANRDVLHCTNGVLDLQTFALAPHSPAWMCTLSTQTYYLPDARHEMWEAYLDLFLPDSELRAFVQRVLGYCLLDGNPERLLLLVNGKTSTGKSTLNEMMLAALGGYARPFNLSMLRANQDEKPRADIAEVLNCRYVSAVEASNQWRLHADQIKRITGGDMLAARFPYDRVATVRVPAYVPFIFTNAVPSITGRDQALDRRLLVLPFNQSVPASADNARARSDMTQNPATRAAFLAWVVDGLKAYRANGLDPIPDAVRASTEAARREYSDLDRFLYDRCEFGEDKVALPAELYDAYFKWSHLNGNEDRDILTGTLFGLALNALGHEKVKGYVPDLTGDRKRAWVRKGLALKEPSWDR
jgi:putative DNA primase/helicase